MTRHRSPCMMVTPMAFWPTKVLMPVPYSRSQMRQLPAKANRFSSMPLLEAFVLTVKTSLQANLLQPPTSTLKLFYP